MSTLSEKRQREKLAARPLEIDYGAALAIAKQQLTDLMDDKYLGLSEEINALRREVRVYLRPRVRWWTRVRHYISRPRDADCDD